jgi:hypothetical protein
MKLKRGDRVRVVGGTCLLKHGQIYTVDDVDERGSVLVTVAQGLGHMQLDYNLKHFELVEASPKQEEIEMMSPPFCSLTIENIAKGAHVIVYAATQPGALVGAGAFTPLWRGDNYVSGRLTLEVPSHREYIRVRVSKEGMEPLGKRFRMLSAKGSMVLPDMLPKDPSALSGPPPAVTPDTSVAQQLAELPAVRRVRVYKDRYVPMIVTRHKGYRTAAVNDTINACHDIVAAAADPRIISWDYWGRDAGPDIDAADIVEIEEMEPVHRIWQVTDAGADELASYNAADADSAKAAAFDTQAEKRPCPRCGAHLYETVEEKLRNKGIECIKCWWPKLRPLPSACKHLELRPIVYGEHAGKYQCLAPGCDERMCWRGEKSPYRPSYQSQADQQRANTIVRGPDRVHSGGVDTIAALNQLQRHTNDVLYAFFTRDALDFLVWMHLDGEAE